MPKILICGYGSIGQKHAKNLKAMKADVRIWRARSSEQAQVEAEGFTFEPSLENGLAWCDGVVVATATDQHTKIALQAAKAQKSYYLEKPVALDLEGLEELQAASKNLVIEVGCQLRHHPALKFLHEKLQVGADGKVLAFQAWVGQRLDQWRPGSDYRACYSADSARGGGALFDLVHEIDLMTWLVGPMESVYADLRHNSDLEMKAEDLANLVLASKNKAAGTVQLDMLSPAYRRGLQIVTERAVYRFDMQEGKLWRAENMGAAECIFEPAADYKPAQMLYDAIAYFLKRLDMPGLPAQCSLEEGVHDLHILLAARKANETGQRQEVV